MKAKELQAENNDLKEKISELSKSLQHSDSLVKEASDKIALFQTRIKALEDENNLLKLRLQSKKYTDDSRYY
jgi:sRNA-binding protein